ncbi:hypothetical protein D9758_017562 [Tetrapyrgos nigripes]|uniref:MULE transposase domain-containing protein n=1 Tax=Tetrapyrgos nigripes TaxID=182062 RepID=A0A8H5FF35_9AGAR|nr:hypothetical protein D9758_017562 [Tetrapyrgos nigripes]
MECTEKKKANEQGNKENRKKKDKVLVDAPKPHKLRIDSPLELVSMDDFSMLLATWQSGPISLEVHMNIHTRRNGGLTPIITLSDKDTSEINALQQEFPETKHQLCYWHAEHAVKTHLSILRRAPTPYNVDQAQSEFPWIDKDFVPRGQHIGVQNSQPDYVAQTCIPRITVQLNSVVQPVPIPVIPKLIIKIPALSDRISPVIDPASEPDSTPEPVPLNIPTQSSMTDSTLPHQLGDEPELGDDMTGDDLQSRIAQDKEIEVDQEDGPDWLLEENEVKSKDPNYVFCPAPHRWQLLHIFTKHFCQHPSFPEQSGTYGAKSIWEHAVAEMYQFCKARGLTEVWGYMWMLWYSPSKWLLWARSSTKYISCLWTTMCVENFWKQLKHHWLHYLIRPRLDQLVWILCTKVVPAWMAKANELEDEH